MQTTLSSKGQIVLPSPIRRKLGLRPGDVLAASVEDGQIILKRRHAQTRKCRIVTDRLTGLPVLTGAPHAQRLTSAQVRELLADFP
jgi:AbrB family looped-hinge helix DNA binding protein